MKELLLELAQYPLDTQVEFATEGTTYPVTLVEEAGEGGYWTPAAKRIVVLS